MLEKQKNLLQEKRETRIGKIVLGIGALAVAYSGYYLLQHGLDPNLSKKSTLKAVAGNLTKKLETFKTKIDS